MDADVRCAEALTIRCAHAMLADDAAVPAMAEDQVRYFEPVRRELRSQAELLEESSRVG